ncbi:MAG: class I SAM-dependent methyltransferase, partial [Candidatus Hermodarchaeota archaeon]
EFTKKILPKINGIVEIFRKEPEEGLFVYIDFIKSVKPSLEKIVQGQRDPIELGHISPRLLRDPLTIDLMNLRRSSEELEAHVVGYIKAILFLVYCGAKGLEGWQFKDTALHEEKLKSQSVGKIDIIPSLVQIVEKEIIESNMIEQLKIKIEKKSRIKEEKIIDVDKTKLRFQGKQNFDYLYHSINSESTDIPFTARLMAYYRSQESYHESPLIVDPFAEKLAGGMASYANKHKFIAGRGDYPLVRSYYIEKNLLTPWCHSNAQSQIILLGAGLDTRAYRFKPLQKNKHIIFEIDFPKINSYKERILKDNNPLCDLERISVDLSKDNWSQNLLNRGYSSKILTFWVLEGLVYYIEQDLVTSILKRAAEMSPIGSQIFVDICVPAIAGLVFGPFTRYFKWGLDKNDVKSFFAAVGWDTSASFADEHDQGRDVGQRGLIFIHGERTIT